MSDTISVTYKLIDGAHFFVSSDKEAEGLCVAHPDLKVAFEEVANQLNVLFEHNHGQKACLSLACLSKTSEGPSMRLLSSSKELIRPAE